ncbi:UNVERIFIED_CONTAM: hypothetical protein Sradi_2625500 [Sesamum radiatum]|uniref:RNase H type-1 domain-containing protein n=1 Tax=Sesamum radiatum TaxID=300843 RepID=A0AAW2S4R6_SESRA
MNQASIQSVASPARWSPPGEGVVKLNFDGALFVASSEVGVGVVARDSAGACLWWKFVRKKGSLEPELVEAFEARDAVLLARSLGGRRRRESNLIPDSLRLN